MLTHSFLETPIGLLTISEENEKIAEILFGKIQNCGTIKETEVILLAKKQLTEYFEGTRHEFSLPLDMRGTEFQKKVWNALLNIEYGKTVSYLDIAVEIGNCKAARAVGMANHNNPISIVVPCHRVIGKSGKLVGYGGGLSTKEWLLNHEKT